MNGNEGRKAAVAGLLVLGLGSGAWGAGALGRLAGRHEASQPLHGVMAAALTAQRPRALASQAAALAGTGEAHMSHHVTFERPTIAAQPAPAASPLPVSGDSGAEAPRETVRLAGVPAVGNVRAAVP